MNTILLFSILAIFSYCKGQNTPSVVSTSSNQNSAAAIGDTVSEIDKSIWSIFQDKNGNFWYGSNGRGVYRYNGKALVQFTMKHGLCHNQVRRINEDKSGNIYFTTGNGISKFDGKTFSTLSVTKSKLQGKGWKTLPDDLWFEGTQDAGVAYRYDGSTLYQLEFPKTKAGEEFKLKFPRSKYPAMTFSPYDVYSIFKDRKGNIWFGTSNLGVCRYDGKSFTWISEDRLGESPVRSIFEDKNGVFWFGNSGQAVYQYKGGRLTDFRKEKGIGNSNGSEKDAPVSYNYILGDKNGELWIVTYNDGIWRYNGENTTNYIIGNGARSSLSMTIYEDNKGGLWLGTDDAGVYKFNGKAFEKFRL